MPGAPRKRHELNERAVTPQQQMCRNVQLVNPREILVLTGIQAVGEELLDIGPAIFAGRQADAVQENKFRLHAGRSFILIGRWTLAGWLDKAARCSNGIAGSHREQCLANGRPLHSAS